MSREVRGRRASGARLGLVVIALVVGVLVGPAPCAAQEAAGGLAPGWRAGLARANITPEGPLWLSGYASRRAPSEGVLHDLWAKALMLEDAGGRRALLVTLDLIGLDRGTAERIREGLRAATGLDEAAIALCCSHTHTGPVVGDNLRPMYDLPPEHWDRIAAYTDRLVRTVVALGVEAREELAPARLRRHRGHADFAVNRRENPEAEVPARRESSSLLGPVDHDVPVLVVEGEEGAAPRAVVFGYACHATVLSVRQVSGDYPGYAQSALERRIPGTQAMFWAGCGADQNPLPRRSVELARDYGEQLAAAVVDALDSPAIAVEGALECRSATVPLAFEEGEAAAYPYPLRCWSLGALQWVFLGGEVVVDYALRLKDELGDGRTWVSAYCDDVMGYIPSERVLREGGYEGGDSGRYYGLPSAWRSGLERAIVDAVRGLRGRPAARMEVACFELDVTPPLGSPLCSGLVPPASRIDDPLQAKGLVLYSDEAPVVLCAMDWVGVGNGGREAFQAAIAEAVGTEPSRVDLHCLHPHDAPGCDFEAEAVLAEQGLGGAMFPVEFARETARRLAEAARRAPRRSVTALGTGVARVERVASNRRILGDDGKVRWVRFSRCTNPDAVAAPEGVIDPELVSWSLWDEDRPRTFSSYYATHPQSHYGQGAVSADFVGQARRRRQAALPGVFHVHFCGAAGNVAAGKYNDGDPSRREELAGRLAQGMRAAWDDTQRRPLAQDPLHHATRELVLPLRDLLADEAVMREAVAREGLAMRDRIRAARDLVFARRCREGRPVTLSALRLRPAEGAPALALHLPGELFVEYQLAARARLPQHTVCVAAYGDYGPGYIGTAVAYEQGGYETGVVSRVGPAVEQRLTAAIAALLDAVR